MPSAMPISRASARGGPISCRPTGIPLGIEAHGHRQRAPAEQVADGGVAHGLHVGRRVGLHRADVGQPRRRGGHGGREQDVDVVEQPGRARAAALQHGLAPQVLDGRHLLGPAHAVAHHRVQPLHLVREVLVEVGREFGRCEAAAAEDVEGFLAVRQREPDHLRAGLGEALNGRFHGGGDARVDVVPEVVGRHADAQSLHAHRGRRGQALALCVEGGERVGQVFHRAGEHARGVERGRQGHDAFDRPAPHGGLQAHLSGHGRGHAHRTGGVGAQRQQGAALHQRDARARAGPAWHAVLVG